MISTHIQGRPVTYEEMVPDHDAWEKASRFQEIWRWDKIHSFLKRGRFPMPPFIPLHLMRLFTKMSVESLGYTPFDTVSGLISGEYVNEYGIGRNGCVHRGWCGGRCNYPCEVGAKSSSHVSTVPAAMAMESLTCALKFTFSGSATDS